jgi:hypothetical protein
MKLCLLFDASAAAHYYLQKESFQEALAFLLSLKEKKEAIFFLPVFCVAEVLNTFAKYRYRLNLIDQEFYGKIRASFTEDVHNRKIFYCYYLNRYHNLNAEEVFEIEHTTKTEFHAVNRFPAGNTVEEKQTSIDSILEEIRAKNFKLGKFYLTSYDILIIGMGMELIRLFGEKRLFIVTKDKRIKDICEAGRSKGLPKAFYLPTDTKNIIQDRIKNL